MQLEGISVNLQIPKKKKDLPPNAGENFVELANSYPNSINGMLKKIGVPGWLSQLSVCLRLRS